MPNLADVLDGGNRSSSTSATPAQGDETSETSQENVEDEKFIVRQMEDVTTGANGGKTRFSVTAFGIQQD